MDELTGKVTSWLAKTGFPLEMRTAAQWEAAGFDVTQSVYFIDPETSEARETDIVASLENVGSNAWLRWFYVIECKAAREAPWVLFTKPGQPLPPASRIRMLGAGRGTRPYLSRIARRLDVKELDAFKSEQAPAYGMVQALREQPDHAFAAMMSIAKAAEAVLKQVSANSEGEESLEIVWPVIITEAPLFRVSLTKAGDIEAIPVNKATLLWRHPIAGQGLSAIDIVRAEVAEAFIASAKKAVELILYNTDMEAGATLQKRRENAAKVQPSTA
jgi:hypothetical protein